MKFAVLLASLLAMIPLAMAMRSSPRLTRLMWIAIGASCFVSTFASIFGMSVIAWPDWSGHTKGLSITGTELLVIAAYLALPRGDAPRPWFPLLLPFWIYLAASTLSIFLSEVPMASLFYAWQVALIFFMAYAVWRICLAHPEAPEALLTGMAIGLCLEALVVVWQRGALGIIQTPGTFGHQNLLGLVTHFVIAPMAVLVFSRPARKLEYLALFAGLLIAALTASRATIGLDAAGLALAMGLSLVKEVTRRKLGMVLMLAAAAAVIVPLALASLQQRFAEAPLDDGYDERAAFTDAATRMIADHPLGIGANMFVVVANTGGYYDLASVAQVETSRSAHVHNVYLLIAAETGLMGLAAFAAMLVIAAFRLFMAGLRDRTHPRGDIILGAGLALLLAAVHSFFEWILILGISQTFLAITMGMGLALAAQSRASAREPAAPAETDYWRKPRAAATAMIGTRPAGGKTR